MPSQLSAPLEERSELAEEVRAKDRILMPMLFEHSQTARALWDLAEDDRRRDVLTLVLTDRWGSAACDFAPEELSNEELFRSRVYDLIGEMIMPRRTGVLRVRVELRDAFAPVDQLEQLRRRLGQIQSIGLARLRLHNQVRFVPQRPNHFLLTNFAIEVDEQFASPVRDAVVECGFQVREDPWLIQREGLREALMQLVDQHRRDGQPNPDFALCFRLQDRETIHLLEVSAEAPELGDGSLSGVGFSALGVVPYAHSIKIYLIHANDLQTAFRVNREHQLFNDIRNDNCEFLLPDDRGEAFRQAFPDLQRA